VLSVPAGLMRCLRTARTAKASLMGGLEGWGWRGTGWGGGALPGEVPNVCWRLARCFLGAPRGGAKCMLEVGKVFRKQINFIVHSGKT